VNTLLSVKKTNQAQLYSEIIAVCSEVHKNNRISLCGQNVEFCLNVRPGGAGSNHWALMGYETPAH
jgi:hypothetical protein